MIKDTIDVCALKNYKQKKTAEKLFNSVLYYSDLSLKNLNKFYFGLSFVIESFKGYL